MRKFDLNAPDIFDQWRAAYETMTNEEHLDFCTRAAEKWPGQKHFTISNFKEELNKPVHVLEIGGWKGELAHEILCNNHEILSWINADFCPVADSQTVVNDQRYRVFCPTEADWFKDSRTRDFDICISAHMIEHLSDKHFYQLVRYLAGIPTIIFEAPIQKGGNNWNGDWSTHILAMGWDGVDAAMEAHGYKTKVINEFCHKYTL